MDTPCPRPSPRPRRNTAVRKFVTIAQRFRTGEQMQKLIAIKFFTKAELREGLKRYIHINYIESR